MESGIATSKNNGLLAASTLFLCYILLCSSVSGCGAGNQYEKLVNIDTSFREGSSNIMEATAVISALGEFDFNNAGFYERAIAEVRSSRDAAGKVLKSSEELAGYSYNGELQRLGGYLATYLDQVKAALDEMEAIYDGIEKLLNAIEPILREEAVITQLEAPQSDAEWMERLKHLDAALEASLSELRSVNVPEKLDEMEAFFLELLTTMQELVREILNAFGSRSTGEMVENNPHFARIQSILNDYPYIIDNLRSNLNIYNIDKSIEAVELEINRLFLEKGH